jgi:hypothetical protein
MQDQTRIAVGNVLPTIDGYEPAFVVDHQFIDGATKYSSEIPDGGRHEVIPRA